MAKPRDPAVDSLARVLETRTADGTLYGRLPGNRVRCVACGHRCVIPDGLQGICRVRVNRGGRLRVPRGYVAGLQADPIEKKPFFHVLPGSTALSFGMLGCDFHCGYCQNWLTSQALRDAAATSPIREADPDAVVEAAAANCAQMVVSTYNEPLITSEWAVEIFSRAKARGLLCGYVSNGNGTDEVLDYLRPWIDIYKVDLKAFRDASYRALGGKLRTVLDTIQGIHRRGIWIEIVTLLVPGWNDGEDELRELCRFLVSVSPDVPWHVTAYHRDYKMRDHADTTARDLLRAAAIGKEEGLRYVYAGNLPGRVGEWESTRCPGCNAVLVERDGYHVVAYRVVGEGRCPDCSKGIAGCWREGWAPPDAGPGWSRRPRALPLGGAR